MSYAGKTLRGRRTALRVDELDPGVRRRAPLAGRAGQAGPGAPRSGRPTARHADDELDWNRLALFATGALVGAAVGAGAALLFAPQTGEETRRDLAREGRRIRHRTADAWDDLRDELQWAARRGKRRVARSLRGRRFRREERELEHAGV